MERRRRLVEDVGAELGDMRTELRTTVRDVQSQVHAKKEALPHPSNFDDEDGDEDEDGKGDGYAQFEEQRQMEMMAEQDEQLDGVFRTVGNLRLQADTMGRELEEQADILDDVDQVTDRVGGKLQTGLKKIGYVIRKNEGECYYCAAEWYGQS